MTLLTGTYTFLIHNSYTCNYNTLLYSIGEWWIQSHDHSSGLYELLTLQTFAEVVYHHLISWTMFSIDLPLLPPIMDQIIAYVDMFCLLCATHFSILLKQYGREVILIDQCGLLKVSLCLKKIFCPENFQHNSIGPHKHSLSAAGSIQLLLRGLGEDASLIK